MNRRGFLSLTALPLLNPNSDWLIHPEIEPIHKLEDFGFQELLRVDSTGYGTNNCNFVQEITISFKNGWIFYTTVKPKMPHYSRFDLTNLNILGVKCEKKLYCTSFKLKSEYHYLVGPLANV